ncbi:MAG: VWA domain-containing protein [Actinomyces sp.]|nr:vWA domain-containing protein [Actinomyces sp.]MCI1641375.1 VWA domain-containing protein [Actinomyces sp.]MCI1662205.1 VWA domain-containing protein [Actinomyces sp.]MCI1690996.1 VWA domain-containing protein [Actinomyces sp.]MCI1787481.1 VWA domain-containing protein [Actinomyces sp.]MCI1829249.1 VWA domain-containing protein [Actinomyces sp.]
MSLHVQKPSAQHTLRRTSRSRAAAISGALLAAVLSVGSFTGLALAEDGDDTTGPQSAESTQSGQQAAPSPSASESAGTGKAANRSLVSDAGGISPMSIPTPGQGEAVVSVKVGADRTGTTSVAPLPGATLGLFSSLNATSPVNGDWAICTSDAQGDCNFVIPDTGNGGANRDRELYVKAVEAPAGYEVQPSLGTGSGSYTSDTYGFRVGGRPTGGGSGWQLRSGNTYTSSGAGNDFMTSSSANSNNASNGVFQFVASNPTVDTCGVDVALILDLSGSVGGSQDQLAGAANTLVDSLVGTDSSVSLYTFSTSSPATVWAGSNTNTVILPNHSEQQSVSTAAGATTVKNWYSNANGTAKFTPSGGTNWDRGIYAAASSGNDYDIAIVLTDGNPTFYSTPNTGGDNAPMGNGNRTRFAEVEEGIFSANALKDAGTRVIAVGVGSGVTSEAAGDNLAAISGATAGSDYFQTTDYSQAGQALKDMISASCAGNITVVKQVVNENTTGEDITGATPAQGWTFTASSSNPDVTVDPSRTTVAGTGAASFPLDFATGTEQSDLTFAEQQRDDYQLVTQDGKNAVCTDLSSGSAVPVTNAGDLGFTIADVGSSANISCVVYNRPHQPSATVEVDKTWVVNGVEYQQGSQPDGLTATARLTGPDGAPATNQQWGAARAGYSAGETVAITENAGISASLVGCSFVSQQVTSANGAAVSAELPYEPTLEAGANEYTITNTVTCTTKLTLIKQVIGGTADPTDWTFTARTVPDDPTTGTPVAGLDGAALGALAGGNVGVTVEVDPATLQLSEQDGPATYKQQFVGNRDTQESIFPFATGSWDCRHVDDELQQVDTFQDGMNGGVTVGMGTHVACTAYNLTGTVTLLKHVVNDDGGSLEASDWNLTATPESGVDGLSASTVAGDEKVTAANTFTVRPQHTYSITEAAADGRDLAYFQVKVQRYLGQVGADGSVDQDDDSQWEDVDPNAIQLPLEDNAHEIYRVVNADVFAVSLPLTGGMSTDAFLLGGGGLLAAAGAGWLIHRRRRSLRA